jgi:acetyl-CoA C-acetyltransferase
MNQVGVSSAGTVDTKHTPVLIAIGAAMQREEHFERAMEPMDLMLQAVAAAGLDSQSANALRGAQYIAVPHGRWSYRNPAGEIARRVGAVNPMTVLASVGVLQQTLIGEACARIARGEIHTALVAGADAGYRLLRAQIAGRAASERVQHDEPEIYLQPRDELRHAVERRAGLHMPVGLYAIMESAWRARQGWTVAEHRDRLARLWNRFSKIAAANPHAWKTEELATAFIREPSAHNPMQAFPYTRAHCSTWNVDQAAALLFCSADRAEELGIPRSNWIFPVASTESNHMVPVSAREDLASCPGAQITGQAALQAAGLRIDDIDLVDFYSCFPLAVQTYAASVGLSLERDTTVTGGMAFAGGPYNNYYLQASCRIAQLLRQGQGRNALQSCVSGVVTKQAFGVWSVEQPRQAYVHADLSGVVARSMPVREVLDTFTGQAKVAGYTVLYERGASPKGIALVDTPAGQRAMVCTADSHLIAALEDGEWVGRTVCIQDDVLLGVA